MSTTGTVSLAIAEMREFASFSAGEQRYIKCSLDVGLGRQDAFRLWARDNSENAAIRGQYVAYQDLKLLREEIPGDCSCENIDAFIGRLVRVASHDLSQEKITSFSAFRFLYERLLGAAVRPWLPSAFCAASALPIILPSLRKTLLQSLSEAAATAPGWSETEPGFFPEYVDKEAA